MKTKNIDDGTKKVVNPTFSLKSIGNTNGEIDPNSIRISNVPDDSYKVEKVNGEIQLVLQTMCLRRTWRSAIPSFLKTLVKFLHQPPFHPRRLIHCPKQSAPRHPLSQICNFQQVIRKGLSIKRLLYLMSLIQKGRQKDCWSFINVNQSVDWNCDQHHH